MVVERGRWEGPECVEEAGERSARAEAPTLNLDLSAGMAASMLLVWTVCSPAAFAPAVVPAPALVHDAGRMYSRASGVVMMGGRVDKERRAANAPGPFFVDESCIDCDTCRWMAPGTFGRSGPKSFVHTQPETAAERLKASEAAVACPTGSIRTEHAMVEAAAARDAFPKPIDAHALPNVYHMGWHSPASFGAASYLLSFRGSAANSDRDTSAINVIIDSPRYNSRLAKALEARGGVHLLLLTHKDDVSDHIKWKVPASARARLERKVRAGVCGLVCWAA
jgi:ferredoxin